ncbi:MAG TPA: hypothetical protein VM260_23430 [Pirellula sp.]|nr:hypothetical protein [Pirellula sp.]
MLSFKIPEGWELKSRSFSKNPEETNVKLTFEFVKTHQTDSDNDAWGLSDHPPENVDKLLKIPDSELGLPEDMRAALEILANLGDTSSETSDIVQSADCKATLYKCGDLYSIQAFPECFIAGQMQPIFIVGLQFRIVDDKPIEITADMTEWNHRLDTLRLESPEENPHNSNQ